jgi:hypothetical protein
MSVSKKLPKNSLEKRNLARHPMPPPTERHKDKKKDDSKNNCRKSLKDNELQ